MTSTAVKYITHAMRGAPVINGNTPGCLIAVLDALLVTGWGATTALSVSVSGGIATATVNAGSSFTEGAVVRIEGATPAVLNGDARVLTASNAQITFATTAPDGVAMGAITLKYASAGWEKIYGGTAKAVYRPTDVSSARFCLRVDDTNGRYARVRGYESMTDVDSGTNPFPTDSQMSGGGYWHKSGAASAVAVPYLLAADALMLLVGICVGNVLGAYTNANIFGFGEGLHLSPSGDPYATMLSCSSSSGDSISVGALSGAVGDSSGDSGLVVFARDFAGATPSLLGRPIPESGSSAQWSGADNTFGTAPSPFDAQVKLARVLVRAQVTDGSVRTVVPGCLCIPQSGARALFTQLFGVVDGAGEYVGRRLCVVHVGANYSSLGGGVGFVDITGPWR